MATRGGCQGWLQEQRLPRSSRDLGVMTVPNTDWEALHTFSSDTVTEATHTKAEAKPPPWSRATSPCLCSAASVLRAGPPAVLSRHSSLTSLLVLLVGPRPPGPLHTLSLGRSSPTQSLLRQALHSGSDCTPLHSCSPHTSSALLCTPLASGLCFYVQQNRYTTCWLTGSPSSSVDPR